jgi:hypothetical protein
MRVNQSRGFKTSRSSSAGKTGSVDMVVQNTIRTG